MHQFIKCMLKVVQPVRGGRSFEGIRLNKRERGGGAGGGATQSVRGNYKPFKGINLTVLEGIHQFIMYQFIMYIL